MQIAFLTGSRLLAKRGTIKLYFVIWINKFLFWNSKQEHLSKSEAIRQKYGINGLNFCFLILNSFNKNFSVKKSGYYDWRTNRKKEG